MRLQVSLPQRDQPRVRGIVGRDVTRETAIAESEIERPQLDFEHAAAV